MKKHILLFTLLLGSFSLMAQEEMQESPETIPPFSIVDFDGQTFTNEDLSKRTDSYIVYFNPECGHCEIAFRKLNKQVEALDLKKVTFYAVAANTKEITEKFFKEVAPEVFKLKNLKILLDEDFVFANAFMVGSYPTVYFYDKKGNFVSRHEGSADVLKPIEGMK